MLLHTPLHDPQHGHERHAVGDRLLSVAQIKGPVQGAFVYRVFAGYERAHRVESHTRYRGIPFAEIPHRGGFAIEFYGPENKRRSGIRKSTLLGQVRLQAVPVTRDVGSEIGISDQTCLGTDLPKGRLVGLLPVSWTPC